MPHLQSLGRRFADAAVQDMFQELIGADGLHLQPQFTAGDAAEVQKIVDELHFKVDVPPHHRHVLPELEREFMIDLDGGDCHHDRRERRAHFVAEDREEP